MHPDGRLQRLRPAIGHPGAVRAELAGASPSSRARSALDLGVLTGPIAIAAAVRRGAVLRRPDARGDRRPRRALAGARGGRGGARRAGRPVRRRHAARRADPERRAAARHLPLDLGLTRGRDLAGAAVPRPPASRLELSPADAERLGIATATASTGRRRTARSVDGDRRACAATSPPAAVVPRPRRSQTDSATDVLDRGDDRPRLVEVRAGMTTVLATSATTRPGGSRSSRRS